MRLSSSSGYLVRRCISEMMRSFSCSRRHCGWLSASWGAAQSGMGGCPPARLSPRQPGDTRGTSHVLFWPPPSISPLSTTTAPPQALPRPPRVPHLHEELKARLLPLLGSDQLQRHGLVGAELRSHLLEFLKRSPIELGRRRRRRWGSPWEQGPLPPRPQGPPPQWLTRESIRSPTSFTTGPSSRSFFMDSDSESGEEEKVGRTKRSQAPHP